MATNGVSREVVEKLNAGAQFPDIRDLVAGARGRTVYETGDIEAGVWTVGLCQGLINDIPTCAELVPRIVDEAVDIIQSRLASFVAQ
ncbi:Nitronate monooxygenase [Corynebacterium capitovis DSM 44611]|nr:Nitronate monooxygenase [Corynebacterium capitovis DSM 44611]